MLLLNQGAIKQPPLLIALEEFHNIQEQVQILRDVKNELTGHELRKIAYICAGLIPCLSKILNRTGQEEQTGNSSNVDQLWLQASHVIGIIANAGPSFTEPILHGELTSLLLNRIFSGAPPRLALSLFRTLIAIADNLPVESIKEWPANQKLSQQIYTISNAQHLCKFVQEGDSDNTSQQICNLALTLICKTCTNEKHRTILVNAGLLSVLCRKIATYVLTEDVLTPHAYRKTSRSTLSDRLCPVLETVNCLIEYSHTNAEKLYRDSILVALTVDIAGSFTRPQTSRGPWGTNQSPALMSRNFKPTVFDSFLPYIPLNENLRYNHLSGFPPLGSADPLQKRRTSSTKTSSELINFKPSQSEYDEVEETVLISWLLYLVRNYHFKIRSVAARTLALLQKHKMTNIYRINSFISLLIPVLVQMLDSEYIKDNQTSPDEKSLLLTGLHHIKSIPATLALVVMDDYLLQEAAVNAKAIPKLATALKSNFDVSDNINHQIWWPTKQNKSTGTGQPDSSLGFGGPSLQDRNDMIFREGLLEALAALAPFNDFHRKEICDQGALNQIMLSLEPFQGSVIPSPQGNYMSITGNSASVLLAACGAVRALTRSVTSLRTKLVDADVGKAIVRLMDIPDPAVRIAATKVISNLVMDFSPIKQTICDSHVVKRLCEQAHSAHARLRFESLWALKTLVYDLNLSSKRKIVDDLGTNWIRHLIATDPHDVPPGDVIGLVERDYLKGSLARLQNADDTVMDDLAADDKTKSEDMYNRHSLNDDIEIQEQLLGFLSNLFCGEKAGDIVTYFVDEIGPEEFFQIMLDRLRSRLYTQFSRRDSQVLAAPVGIVLTTLSTLKHVAASDQRFRQMICLNLPLLKQIALFCSHEDSRIRVSCCWFAINLMYKVTESDAVLRQRANELNRAGFKVQMRRMQTDDPDLDVKERAKSAMLLFDQHLII